MADAKLPKDPTVEQLMPYLLADAKSVAAKTSKSTGVEFSELHSAALFGLAMALDRWPAYTAEHGYSQDHTRYLRTFVGRRIQGAALDYLRGLDHVSRPVRDRARRLRDAEDADPRASREQIAAAAGMTPAEADKVLAAVITSAPCHLEDLRPLDAACGDVLPDPADVQGDVVTRELLAVATDAIRRLPIAMQFAVVLTIYHGLSVRQAAAAMDLPPATVTAGSGDAA